MCPREKLSELASDNRNEQKQVVASKCSQIIMEHSLLIIIVLQYNVMLNENA
jgi:hypothetical protein